MNNEVSPGRTRSLLRWGTGLALAGLLAISGQALAGVKDSKHNLGAGTSAATRTNYLDAGGTTEICVFCHTPHAADTDIAAPLWNKGTPDTSGYTVYSSTTMDATMDKTKIGSVSLACLSCHDGTQAMDNIINAPGSGGYTSGGANQTWTWAAGGAESITGLANLTEGSGDLSNDHPISIKYCGGGLNTTTTSGVATNCADKDFNEPQYDSTKTVWWVDTGATGSGTRQKSDIILYTRADLTSGTTEPSVECASCHDPHQSTTATFLRVSNDNSAVCLACHAK